MPWIVLPDGTRAHVLVRGRPGKLCASCSAFPAPRDCDGCDRATCENCAVSPREGLDFCPGCARPAFVFYLGNAGGRATFEQQGRAVTRISFREWARANTEKFLSLARRRSAASLRAEAKAKR